MRTRPRLVRQTVVLYLLGIVVPAVALLYLAWRSIEQQRAAIDALTDRNVHLQLERVATDLETRVGRLAIGCARDEALVALAKATGVSAESARRVADGVRTRHPIAAHVFVLRGGRAVYPAAEPPLLARIEEIAGDDTGAATILTHAEALEGNAAGDAQALEAYHRVAYSAQTPAVRALALARLARCERRLGHTRQAALAWRELAERYRDERDLASQPYGLLAAIEEEPAGDRDRALGRARLAYADLVGGRWTLSPVQVEYFLPLLETRLGRDTKRPATAFLAEYRFAAALRETAPRLSASPGTAAWARVGASDTPYVVVLTGDADATTGCAVRPEWIRDRLLPSVVREVESREPQSSFLLTAADGSSLPAGTTRAFADALRGYRLTLQTPAARQERHGVWAFAGATAGTLMALASGVLLLLRDVARQRATNRLQQDLVSGVSHELKTPLTLIRVYAETLAEDPAAPATARREYTDVIVREAQRLGTLIDRVLTFSRVDRGERRYVFTPSDVGTMAARTAATYGAFLKGRGFVVEAAVQQELPLVRCDGDAVAEALVNLIDNAAKYSGESRHIAIVVRIACKSDVAIEVADEGPGIPPDETPLIFERFYRGREQEGRGGYGLGLFLVRHMAEAHGGRAEVDSVPGRGSRFRIRLPIDGPTA